METLATAMVALPLLPMIVVYVVGFFIALTTLRPYAKASRNAAVGFALLLIAALIQIAMQISMMQMARNGTSAAMLAQRAMAFAMTERLLAVVGMVFLLLAVLADRRDARVAN